MRLLVWRWYLGCGLAAAACYPLVGSPLAQDGLYLAIGLSSVVAIGVGVRANRPSKPAPWWLMFAGLALWVIGDAVDGWQQDIAHVDVYPSVVDAFYLSAYPVIACGLWKLFRAQVTGRDRAGLLDSAILTVGAGVVSWAALGHPILELYRSSAFSALVSVGYPAGDIVLLALLCRLITYASGRTAAFRLLTAAVVLLIAGDTASTAGGLWLTAGNSGYDVVWLVSYLAWGAAALHPSMSRLTDRAHRGDRGSSGHSVGEALHPRRLAALAVATCLAPSVLAVERITGIALDVWAVVAGSITLFLLVVARMNLAMRAVVAATKARDRMQKVLAHQATHDALTGLPNRVQAMAEIAAAQARAQRSGTLLALLFIDLDGFKSVNDACGHAAGDTVLLEISDRLRGEVRGGDLVARLGGDEFVVLLENVPHETEAVTIATRVVDVACQPVSVRANHTVQVGASVGVALSQDGHVDADRLLNEADVAVYRAKTAGKNRVEVFDDRLRRELADRDELETALAAAIAHDQLVAYYQPIVDVRSGDTVGYEALVRWQHPRLGLIPPGQFVPIAEQSDIICDLDVWMLRTATTQIASLPARDRTVAVNISGRHVSSPRIVRDVEDALAASGLDPARLVLEITETVLTDDLRAATHLRALRDLGVAVSIDDFGTGYSSISRLQNFPIDAVKIDRSFIAASDDRDHALLEVIIRAASSFGLSTVGEGVETAAQLRLLEQLGCTAAQGFLLSRPLPFEALEHDIRDLRLLSRSWTEGLAI